MVNDVGYSKYETLLRPVEIIYSENGERPFCVHVVLMEAHEPYELIMRIQGTNTIYGRCQIYLHLLGYISFNKHEVSRW